MLWGCIPLRSHGGPQQASWPLSGRHPASGATTGATWRGSLTIRAKPKRPGQLRRSRAQIRLTDPATLMAALSLAAESQEDLGHYRARPAKAAG
jgi:hypothetical protein